MTIGFARSPHGPSASPGRCLGLQDWSECGVPLLRDPRGTVRDLYSRHLPSPSTAVVGVLDQEQRLVASASFTQRKDATDGWGHRNSLLWHLRRVVPHDLRLRTPVRTGVLLFCRDGGPEWTPADGAWMWALHDACALHGLRCGAYTTLTSHGWYVLGDGRSGRTPHSGSWALEAADGAAVRPVAGAPEALRRTAAR